MNTLLKLTLFGGAGLAAAAGVLFFIAAKSAVHEIEAMIALLIAAVFWSGLVVAEYLTDILAHAKRFEPRPSEKTELIR